MGRFACRCSCGAWGRITGDTAAPRDQDSRGLPGQRGRTGKAGELLLNYRLGRFPGLGINCLLAQTVKLHWPSKIVKKVL